MQRRNLGLTGLGSLPDPRQTERDEIERRYQAVMADSGLLTIRGRKVHATWDQLEVLADIGNGSCGQVSKFKFGEVVMAVKQMSRTSNPEENKRIIMDLAVVSKTAACPNIVYCYGYFISDLEVRVCMELMATCLDRLLKRTNHRPFPEAIVGKMAVSIISALDYLKNEHNVIHRDVKPSNILMDWNGTIKLCDFGISGILMESKAHSLQAGCPPYMAPERFDAQHNTNYDIRSDVWSLGISLVELATGRYPYTGGEFEILSAIIQLPSPTLQESDGFTHEFCDFVAQCLKKNHLERPKYQQLMDHPFMAISRNDQSDVGEWFASQMELDE